MWNRRWGRSVALLKATTTLKLALFHSLVVLLLAADPLYLCCVTASHERSTPMDKTDAYGACTSFGARPSDLIGETP